MQADGAGAVTTETESVAARAAAVLERAARAAQAAGRDPSSVTVVAASKTFSPQRIAQAHAGGIRHFGENWVQEAAQKIPACTGLQPRPQWHMIGHLQTNKVRAALALFDVIESVDSVRLGEALARRAGERRIPLLLEVNMAGEASKFGLAPAQVPAAVRAMRALPELDVRGLMTVAPAVPDPEQVRPLFRALRELAEGLGLR